MDTNTKTTKRNRVSNEQLGAKLDTLIELLIAQAHARDVAPTTHEVTHEVPEPEAVPSNKPAVPGGISERYRKHQGEAMAQYAAERGVRYYMFRAFNKQNQLKLRFYSEDNVRKYGTDMNTAVAYCDPGKATVWK